MDKGTLPPVGTCSITLTGVVEGCLSDYQNALLRHLLGKILTIVDAVFSDAEQRKAAKDLVKNVFNNSPHVGTELKGFLDVLAGTVGDLERKCQFANPSLGILDNIGNIMSRFDSITYEYTRK